MTTALFLQLLIGAAMIAFAVMFHAVALDFIMRRADTIEKFYRKLFRSFWKPWVVGGIVLSVFVTHVIIMWFWAGLFYFQECAPIENFSEALYFSTVVYTTLGFGDIVMDESCRMLSGIEGANGFILFGWTSAYIYEIVGQIYRKEAKLL